MGQIESISQFVNFILIIFTLRFTYSPLLAEVFTPWLSANWNDYDVVPSLRTKYLFFEYFSLKLFFFVYTFSSLIENKECVRTICYKRKGYWKTTKTNTSNSNFLVMMCTHTKVWHCHHFSEDPLLLDKPLQFHWKPTCPTMISPTSSYLRHRFVGKKGKRFRPPLQCFNSLILEILFSIFFFSFLLKILNEKCNFHLFCKVQLIEACIFLRTYLYFSYLSTSLAYFKPYSGTYGTFLIFLA